MGTILVGYVTKTNTTKEIAERIGAILSTAGPRVEVRALTEVEKVDSYESLILGSPINAMRPVPEFTSWVQKTPGVSGKTAGLFIVSYLYGRGRGIFQRMMKGSIGKARLATKARALAVFGGRVPDRMPAPARLLFGLPKDMPLDIRDWNEIERWAETLAKELGAAAGR